MQWTVCWFAAWAIQISAAAPEIRFHHFHLGVADPAAAMTDAALRMGAVRTILQGHGPAVRTNETYLVFDRSDENDPTPGASVYSAVVRWASERGLAVSPSELQSIAIAAGAPAARINAVAFSSPDPARIIEHLRAQGTEPHDRSPDVARFRAAPGIDVEIIAETDLPDTHWCPMHPGIRAAGRSKCTLCGMDLVPIPPPATGEYALDVTIEPRRGGRETTRLRLEVREPRAGQRVTSFVEMHERLLHLFVISRDLSSFAHVHPDQQPDGTFAIDHDLAAGEYMLIADFLPANGTPQMVHHAIVTPGYRTSAIAAIPNLQTSAREQLVDGLRVRLEASVRAALRPAPLRFTVSDEQGPVTDLQPYLGAPAHLLVVSPDLTFAIHAHPEAASSGPDVAFEPVLPLPGHYKLWLQFQRKGRVVTAPFVIEVAPR